MLDRALTRNRLLRALEPDDFDRLAGAARLTDLQNGLVLYEAEASVDKVWFPETGLISIISCMLSGSMVETSVVGCEGGIGFIEAAGGGTVFSRAVVQVPGQFVAVPAEAYRAAFDASASLRRTVQNHIELLLTECRQAMACIALHSVDQRLAWWLLEAQDRIGGREQLPLTQEFLSVMLGVTRPTVSIVASRLQNAGLIKYSRGSIVVLDRGGLEGRACECYATSQHFRRRIEGGRGLEAPHSPAASVRPRGGA
jgi:CRP-like cAMP-binding protein